MSYLKKLSRSQAGLTLIEMLVVVTIIATLMGTLVYIVNSRRESINRKLAKTGANNLMQTIEDFKSDNYFYPSTEQGLRALVEKPTSGKPVKNYPEGGYLGKNADTLLMDPWGTEYYYENNGQPKVCSAGADKKESTGDDICSDE